MAVSIDWPTRVITINKVDMIEVTADVEYNLDLDTLRDSLRALEASEAGRSHPTTHQFVDSFTFGNTTIASIVFIHKGFTYTIEDGTYTVNVIGGNSNLGVAGINNKNQVSVNTNNSAGLTEPLASALWDALTNDHAVSGSFGAHVKSLMKTAVFLALKGD